jgi:hypothetical protein
MKKNTKISKSDLSEIIMETIYEMIKGGDEGLISLMRESEKMSGDVDSNMNEWVEKTMTVLEESLGIDPEEKEVAVISEEMVKMIHLADITEES